VSLILHIETHVVNLVAVTPLPIYSKMNFFLTMRCSSYCLYFDCSLQVMHLDAEKEMMSQCVALLGKFIAVREPNIRYLGLVSLGDTFAKMHISLFFLFERRDKSCMPIFCGRSHCITLLKALVVFVGCHNGTLQFIKYMLLRCRRI